MAIQESAQKAAGFVNQMEKILLKGEIELKNTQFSPGTLQSLLQVIHQIKSELTLLGRTRATALIHSVGEELSAKKKGRGRLSPTMIQGLFTIVDQLRFTLSELEEPDDFPMQFTPPEPSEKSFQNIYFPLTSSEEKSLELSLSRSQVYLLEKAIPPFLNAEQIANLSWYTDLREMENILFIHPEFKRLSMLEEEQVVSVVFVSQKPLEELKNSFHSPVLEIRKAEKGSYAASPNYDQTPFPDLQTGQWRILVIEDDFFDRHFLQDALNPYGKVDVATNSQEALDAVQKALASGDPYHLITLDQFLGPDLGEHVIKDIRQAEADQASFPSKVLVISQDTSGETIMNLLQNDVQAYMVKPVTNLSLLRHLEKMGFIL